MYALCQKYIHIYVCLSVYRATSTSAQYSHPSIFFNKRKGRMRCRVECFWLTGAKCFRKHSVFICVRLFYRLNERKVLLSVWWSMFCFEIATCFYDSVKLEYISSLTIFSMLDRLNIIFEFSSDKNMLQLVRH